MVDAITPHTTSTASPKTETVVTNPLSPELIQACEGTVNPERALHALKFIVSSISDPTEKWIQAELKALAVGAGSGRDLPDTEGLVGAWHGLRAIFALGDCPDSTHKALIELLEQAESQLERAILLKEIGALFETLAGEHTDQTETALQSIRAFANVIRGQEHDWFQNMTTAYATQNRGGLGSLENASCVPAITGATVFEAQPSSALDGHQNPLTRFANQANELKSNGAATPFLDLLIQQKTKDAQNPKDSGDSSHSLSISTTFQFLIQLMQSNPHPMNAGQSAHQLGEALGITYDTKPWGRQIKGQTAPTTPEILENFVRNGIDIPIIVSSLGSNHLCTIVDCFHSPKGDSNDSDQEPKNTRRWRIFNPGAGLFRLGLSPELQGKLIKEDIPAPVLIKSMLDHVISQIKTDSKSHPEMQQLLQLLSRIDPAKVDLSALKSALSETKQVDIKQILRVLSDASVSKSGTNASSTEDSPDISTLLQTAAGANALMFDMNALSDAQRDKVNRLASKTFNLEKVLSAQAEDFLCGKTICVDDAYIFGPQTDITTLYLPSSTPTPEMSKAIATNSRK